MGQHYTCLARGRSDMPRLAPKTGARTWGTGRSWLSRKLAPVLAGGPPLRAFRKGGERRCVPSLRDLHIYCVLTQGFHPGYLISPLKGLQLRG